MKNRENKVKIMSNDTQKRGEQRMLTEIPSSLKQLARLVVRGFYTIEDALIIDMLVRNPCMKEDDICELLKFERKQLRSRISLLRTDKFLQVRLKMETGPDGKAAKVNYYYINYKTFVNVVKYKLDLMRKRMETEERDAASRASFKCPNCIKTFTDLEADQLFDFQTGEFRCTFCSSVVEEDMSAMPKKDSRLLLAKFNEQLQPLYDLLREVEDIKLSPECLEPEPTDIDSIRGLNKYTSRTSNEPWSGEATRNQGFAVEETRIDVTLGNAEVPDAAKQKDRPVWMTESTVISNDPNQQSLVMMDNSDSILYNAAQSSAQSTSTITTNSGNSNSASGGSRHRKDNDDIMSVLLQHEKQQGTNNANSAAVKNLNSGASRGGSGNSSDSSADEREIENTEIPDIDIMDSESEDDAPVVMVAGRPYPIDEINDEYIAQMTQQEKDTYIQVYQEHFSHMYD